MCTNRNSVNIKQHLQQMNVFWYGRSYYNKNTADDNFDPCEVFFRNSFSLSLFAQFHPRPWHYTPHIQRILKFYRLDMLMLCEVNFNDFYHTQHACIQWTVDVCRFHRYSNQFFSLFTLFWESVIINTYTHTEKVERCKFWTGDSGFDINILHVHMYNIKFMRYSGWCCWKLCQKLNLNATTQSIAM